MDKNFWHRYYKERKDILSDQPDELLIQEASKLQPGTALDVGAGSGHNSVWLAEQGWRVYALDYARSATEIISAKAQSCSLDSIVPVTADITQYRPPLHFDLVCIPYIHVERETRLAMFKNIARFTKPGGSIIYIGIHKKEHPTPSNDPFNDLCTSPEVLYHELESIFAHMQCIRSETLHKRIPIDEGEYFEGEVFILHIKIP